MKITKALNYFLSFALAMFFCNGLNVVSLETLDVVAEVHQENDLKFHFLSFGLKESEIEESEDGDANGIKLKFHNPPHLQTITSHFKDYFAYPLGNFRVYNYPSANKTPLFLLFENFRI